VTNFVLCLPLLHCWVGNARQGYAIAGSSSSSPLFLFAFLQRQSYKHGPFLIFIALATAWFLLLAYMIIYSQCATVRRFAWGVSGGSLTGFQNFLKDTLTIIKATHHDDSQHEQQPQRPWILLGVFIAMAALTAFGGLLLLTGCMKRYDATYSSAMFVGSFVVSASIMSAVHYDTFDHLNGLVNAICYPAGLAILMAGVYMLIAENPRLPVNDNVDDNDNEDQEVDEAARAQSPSRSSVALVGGCFREA
jgi:cytochrome b